MKDVSWLIWFFVILFLSAQASIAEEILALNQSFIERYKNRHTIDVRFVNAAHKNPNPSKKKDGDMRGAGRALEVGLATVAEIQNAMSLPDAFTLINAEGLGQAVFISGVRRIWSEHGGDKSHIQQMGAGSPYEGL